MYLEEINSAFYIVSSHANHAEKEATLLQCYGEEEGHEKPLLARRPLRTCMRLT